MQIIHVIRNAPNWLELNLDNYLDQANIHKCITSKMRPIIQQWNSILCPDYFIFRDKLSSIAASNHNKLNVDLRLSTSFHLEERINQFKSPFIVLICDDDDWYCSKVIDFISSCYRNDPNLDIISWRHSVLNTNYKYLSNAENPNFHKFDTDGFLTNNYCLTDNFFRKLDEKDYAALNYGVETDLSYDHRILNQYKNRMNIHFDDGRYSMSNKTVASYSGLIFATQSWTKIIDIIIKCQNYAIEIPDEFMWASDEIKQVMDLYKSLKFDLLL